MTDFDRVGGFDRVNEVMADLIARCAGDFIIGYFFEGRDLKRIVNRETELAAAHLGGPTGYSGRPIGAVHQPLRINRGHFRRRLAFLRLVLADHGIPEDVQKRWLAHDSALEPVVTDGSDCAVS